MFQPHTIICCGKWLYIKRDDGADYHCGVPLGVRINPLRYHITPRWKWRNLFTINREGVAARHLSNAIYWLRTTLSKGGNP